MNQYKGNNEIGKAIDNEITLLNKDGNCEVIRESEYFGW